VRNELTKLAIALIGRTDEADMHGNPPTKHTPEGQAGGKQPAIT